MLDFLKKLIFIVLVFILFMNLAKIFAINMQKQNEKDKVLHEIYDSIKYAILANEDNNKPVSEWEWHNFDSEFAAEYILKKRILPYLTNYKICKDSYLDCVVGFSYLNRDDYEYINFRRSTEYARALVGIYNAHIALKIADECKKNRSDSVCGVLIIDINNKDAPNTMGYDVFKFAFYGDGSFLPYGSNWPRKDIEEECSLGFSGETCAAKIMLDYWTMRKGGKNPYFIYKK